ncbi:MAG: hypothetical protein AAFW75_27165, partial [Cyanobacteria bacterium J06636_16]
NAGALGCNQAGLVPKVTDTIPAPGIAIDGDGSLPAALPLRETITPGARRWRAWKDSNLRPPGS